MRRNNNSKNRVSTEYQVGQTATLSAKVMDKIRQLNAESNTALQILGAITAKYEEEKATLFARAKAAQTENSKALKAAALVQHGIDLGIPDQVWNLDLSAGTLTRAK